MLRGRKLLLADDSIAIRKVIELTFEDEGMQVVSVGDGRQAVEQMAEVRPDVVLADVYMPGLNGYQVCEQIKLDERFRHIPVILLVGSFEPFNEAEARRVGADDYLTKPFQSIRQMVSKVGALLSGNKSEAEAGTQKLPPRTESQERMNNLELRTADTAPLPPHMRQEAEAETDAPQATGPFTDLQLDDQMIEETPASDYSSADQKIMESHQRPTEPLSTQDLRDAGLKPAAASTGQQFAASGAGVWADESREAASVREQSPTQSAAGGNASDDALLDLDDVEMPHASAMAEADDFILDLQDTSEARPKAAAAPEAVSSSFETAWPSVREDEAVIEAELTQRMTEAAPQAAEFTEAQFTNDEQRDEFAFTEEQSAPAGEFHFYQQSAATASPATEFEPETQSITDSAQMHETHELQSSPSSAPIEELTESFDYQAPPVQAEGEASQADSSAVETRAAGSGQIGLEQLSPEAIDAIARRVVEQLSTKVVEQIAWEVVPPLAELLIKRRLEEEKSGNR